MATLSSKTTSGDLSFNKYVKDNKRFAEIEYEIEKGMSAPLIEKKGAKFAETLTLKELTKFNILEQKLTKIGTLDCVKVKYKVKVGYVPIKFIRKPTTTGNGTSYEDDVIDALNDIFLKMKRPLTIKVGNKSYPDMTAAIKVDSAIKRKGGVSSDPKADIIICADKKNPLAKGSIYISHKKEGGPEAFQQYGGITETAGSDINNHKEVQKFLEKTVGYIEKGQLTNPLMMVVKDDKLSNMSIYGPEYGGAFSLQHVQLIGQGKPKLILISGDTYRLEFTSHMSLSGDLRHFSGGYEPVLGATYRAGRGFKYDGKQHTGARTGIYPRKLIEGRSGLVILK